eukprot:3189685-Amphidinium_carterae.1
MACLVKALVTLPCCLAFAQQNIRNPVPPPYECGRAVTSAWSESTSPPSLNSSESAPRMSLWSWLAPASAGNFSGSQNLGWSSLLTSWMTDEPENGSRDQHLAHCGVRGHQAQQHQYQYYVY